MKNQNKVLEAYNNGNCTRKVTVLPRMRGNDYLTTNGNKLVEKYDIYKYSCLDYCWHGDEYDQQYIIRKLNNEGLYSVTKVHSWTSTMSDQYFFTGITVDIVQL